MLECHPEIFCFDELDSYRVLASGAFDDAIGRPLVGFKIPRWAEQLDASELRDFGLPTQARQIYHGQKILFLVRDFRDAIASMIKLRGQRSWLEEWAEPIINEHVERTEGFAQTWAKELSICRTARNPLIAIGALYWAYKSAALIRYVALGYPVLGICYESLVSRPQDELRRICAFLGVDFTDALLHHPSHSHREILENGLAIGNTDPACSIDSASVGQWPQFLDSADEMIARQIVGDIPHLIGRHLRDHREPALR